MVYRKIISTYKRHERAFSSISLVGGFVFDALTLQRVTEFWENFWIIVHLLVVAAAILVINRGKHHSSSESEVGRQELDFWMVNLLQFTFGGLLSAFLVSYFRGATLAVSWPFILGLVVVFILNERMKRHLERLTFQVSLLYISIFLFAIFAVPIVLKSIGPWVFVLSGLLSILVLRVFLIALERVSGEGYLHSLKMLRLSIAGIFVLMNIFYFANVIPPLPLSLVEGDVYHFVSREPSGAYQVEAEEGSWRDYFKLYPDVHVANYNKLFAFTAVYSPAKLSTSIIHEWQKEDESGKWHTLSRIDLPISGGREAGFRTYSYADVTPGKWRVNVLTSHGQVLGRIGFNVVRTEAEPYTVIEKH